MNQQKPTVMHVSLTKTLLAVAVILAVSPVGAGAQGALGNLVSEGGFDWLIGKWQATTDEGQIQLEYKWELNKNLITIHLKWPDYEYRGMIFYVPAKEEVTQIGVDHEGATGKGTWEAMGNKALLKHEHTGLYGEVNRMGFAHARVDAETMKMEVYEMYSDGELAEEPGVTLQFKRQKTQPAKIK